MNLPKAVRLQDIAERAGVSRATVSLALRNHSSLPLPTRTRIQQLAGQLGYRPNPLVSALMTYQRNTRSVKPTHLTLAMVMKFSRRDSWKSYLSPDLLTGAAASAERQGYHLEEFWLGELRMSAQRLSNILFQRGVPGVILAPLPAAHGSLQLDWSRFSSVAIGHTLAHPDLHRVSTYRFQAMRLAVRRLRQMGYRRLGLALDANQDARVDHQWAAAFQWEQSQVQAAHRTGLFLARKQNWCGRDFVRWFKANEPEAILGYDPEIIAWLRRLGRQVPRDVGFAHLWNPDETGAFAGIYHNPPGLGAAAVDFLIGLIQRNERGVPVQPQTVLLEPRWLDGGTVISK